MRVFFELIQVALGKRKDLSVLPTDETWKSLFAEARRQTLLGFLFTAVQKLPREQQPCREMALRWFAVAEQIRAHNVKADFAAVKLSEELRRDGFRCVILKGQGNALLYPDARSRNPGDIDVWIDGTRRQIVGRLKAAGTKSGAVYHNVAYPAVDGVAVEAHFTPSWMFSPVTNGRLQHWFRQQKEAQFANKVRLPDIDAEISVPTIGFNRIYVLVHIYRHLFGEGIGLRQVLDYYYVLKQGFSEEERLETVRTLARLGMKPFTAAMMYVMQEVFGMEREMMLLPPDNIRGKELLYEILAAGNFGHYDTRRKYRPENTGTVELFVRRTLRNWKFVRNYPSEALWTPFFKLWHFFWRKFHGWT